MSRWKLGIIVYLNLVLSLLVVFFACEKKGESESAKKSEVAVGKEMAENQQFEEQSAIERNLDELLSLIVEKEKEIKTKEKSLDEKIAALNAKQAKLDSLESYLSDAKARFKSYRFTTYLILIIGLAFIVVGVRMIVLQRAPTLASPTQQGPKEEKEQEKEVVKKETKLKEPPNRALGKESYPETKTQGK